MHLIAFIEILIQLYFISHALKNGKPRYWIFLLLIPVVGILVYFLDIYLPGILQDQKNELADSSYPKPAKIVTPELIYISQGKLYHKRCDSKSTQLQSAFGQKMFDKSVEKFEKNKWKSNETGTYFGGSMLWGTDQIDPNSAQVSINSATENRKDGGFTIPLSRKEPGGCFHMIWQARKNYVYFKACLACLSDFSLFCVVYF